MSLAEWWYNTTFHRSTKLTPFEALYGYQPPQLGLGNAPKSRIESVNAFMQHRHTTLAQLKANLLKAQKRMKLYADKYRTKRMGDWVYLKVQPY